MNKPLLLHKDPGRKKTLRTNRQKLKAKSTEDEIWEEFRKLMEEVRKNEGIIPVEEKLSTESEAFQ